MAKKIKTATERRYHEKLSKLPCVLGHMLGENHGPVNIHHIRAGNGLSQRSSHFLCVPLCHDCHQGQSGIHGDRALLRIAKVEELDLLAATIEMVMK